MEQVISVTLNKLAKKDNERWALPGILKPYTIHHVPKCMSYHKAIVESHCGDNWEGTLFL